ncbi:hypothetical protein ACQ3G6_00845 [Allorhizobium undicola]|uniref:hypothetical protein n=1 Tax=Allorhizobium undicola TaxID=78527 RepID=UPI0005663F8C|nr:hypothetical protein [Allorhizobium undicola]
MIETPVTLWFVMVALSIHAYFRLAPRQKLLPMQWTFTGKVAWRAPRLTALSFVPLLVAALLVFVATLPQYASLADSPLEMVAGIGLAVHVLHLAILWLTLS